MNLNYNPWKRNFSSSLFSPLSHGYGDLIFIPVVVCLCVRNLPLFYFLSLSLFIIYLFFIFFFLATMMMMMMFIPNVVCWCYKCFVVVVFLLFF